MLFKTAVFFALCCTFVLAQDYNKSQNFPPQPPPPSPSTTTTVKPTSHSTITTTTSSTTTTTTTSATPTTASTAGTTTEPVPTLAPPTQGQYNVTNGTDICLRANLAVQVELHKDNASIEFDVPYNANYSDSSCNNDTQELKLHWEDENRNFTLAFQFAKNNKKFMITLVTLSIQQNSTFINAINNETEFSTPLSKSYLCDKQQKIKLTEERTNGTVYAVLKLSHVQLQAFFSSKEGKFGAVEDCSGSSSPDIVPIAVGCALVGLIAIVLIAYLVGRRRSQARGYLSM